MAAFTVYKFDLQNYVLIERYFKYLMQKIDKYFTCLKETAFFSVFFHISFLPYQLLSYNSYSSCMNSSLKKI